MRLWGASEPVRDWCSEVRMEMSWPRRVRHDAIVSWINFTMVFKKAWWWIVDEPLWGDEPGREGVRGYRTGRVVLQEKDGQS